MDPRQKALLHSLYAADKLEHVDGLSIQGIRPRDLEIAEAHHKLRAKNGYRTLMATCTVCPWHDHLHTPDTKEGLMYGAEELTKAHAEKLAEVGGCAGTPDVHPL